MTSQADSPEAHIRANAKVVTLINVFTIDPADQEQFVERWQRATDEVMRHRPGFISASIHRSLDGTKVINYAQWESVEAFTAMLQDSEVRAHLSEIGELGRPDPILCNVVSVHPQATRTTTADARQPGHAPTISRA